MRFTVDLLNRPEFSAAMEGVLRDGLTFDEPYSSGAASGNICAGGGCLMYEVAARIRGDRLTVSDLAGHAGVGGIRPGEEFLPSPGVFMALSGVSMRLEEFDDYWTLVRLNDGGELATPEEIREQLVTREARDEVPVSAAG
jgi:hypothetical protein